MKKEGLDNSVSFIVKEGSPILEIKNGQVEESTRKLIKGTIVKGMLKTRIVKMGKEKKPYRFIQLEDSKGYLSPRVVDVYIGDFANLDGSEKKDVSGTKSTSFGQEKPTLKTKVKKVVLAYGLPITGAYIGYQIAKKTGADTKKTIGYVVFFGLLGYIPRYINKNK
jgi:hypothetical protein